MFRLMMCWLFSDASEEETGYLDEEEYEVEDEERLRDAAQHSSVDLITLLTTFYAFFWIVLHLPECSSHLQVLPLTFAGFQLFQQEQSRHIQLLSH